MYEYDSVADRWLRRADLPDSVLSPGLLAHDGLVHVYAGQHRDSESDIQYRRHLQIHDPVLDEWTLRADAIPWLFHLVQVVPGCGDEALIFAWNVYDDTAGAWTPNELVFAHPRCALLGSASACCGAPGTSSSTNRSPRSGT